MRSYVAVGTGKTDRIAAWEVDARDFGRAPQGAEVEVRVTPLFNRTDEEGVPLRRRLEEAREMLGCFRGEDADKDPGPPR